MLPHFFVLYMIFDAVLLQLLLVVRYTRLGAVNAGGLAGFVLLRLYGGGSVSAPP